jgi:hypothetical protein
VHRHAAPGDHSAQLIKLLVKKADGSWWFYVDYRVLNSRTVKDKYPILVVEELLDELRGAAFFTRLDLCSRYHQV